MGGIGGKGSKGLVLGIILLYHCALLVCGGCSVCIVFFLLQSNLSLPFKEEKSFHMKIMPTKEIEQLRD